MLPSFKQYLNLVEDASADPAAKTNTDITTLQGQINDIERKKTQMTAPLDRQINQLRAKLMTLNKQLIAQQSQQKTQPQQTPQQAQPQQMAPQQTQTGLGSTGFSSGPTAAPSM